MDAHPATTHVHGGPKIYAAVLTALLVLTAITVAVSYFEFGNWNVIVALSVASTKAALVALYFMHLRYEKPINAIIFLTGVIFLFIFLLFCYIDVSSRPEVQPSNWKPPAGALKKT